MRMKKSILRFVCAFVVGSIVLTVTAVIYGLATDCPGTAGVYVKCSK